MSEPRAGETEPGGPGGRKADEPAPAAAGGEAPEPRAEERPGREPPKLVRQLRERRETYRQRGRAYRVAWITAGVIVVLAGLAMVVLPGPALVVIPIGLAMLSLEFAWAERLLDATLERGVDAKDIALNASRGQKVVGVAAIVCAIGALAAVALIYVV